MIFALLYCHAYRLRGELELSPMEIYETRGVVQEQLVMISIGGAALGLAFLNAPAFSGMSYALIGPAQAWLGTVHGKGRRRLNDEAARQLGVLAN